MSRKFKPRRRKVLNDGKARWRSIEKKYGLRREDYLRILDEQGGVCYICERDPYSIRPLRWLAVDHNHATGEIRGLLCYSCNHRLIGYLIKDNVRKAKRLHQYLTRKTNYGKVPA